MHVHVEAEALAARADRDSGNRGDVLAPIPMMDERGLAPRRPRSADGRRQLEAGFIGKHEVCVQASRFFLMRGPHGLFPAGDPPLVAFEGAPFRLLARPLEIEQEPTDMGRVISHPEFAMNDE
jgi:hypothetical protein